MSPRRGLAWIGQVVLVVAIVAGCGAGAAPASSAGGGGTATRTLPPCAAAATVEAAPELAAVPLPRGARVTANQTPAGGGAGAVLVAPMTIAELGAFLEEAFPTAGLTLGDGEAEPSELEQSFAGKSLAGRLTARYDATCDGVVTISIVVRST